LISHLPQTISEKEEERRLLRRLQLIVAMTTSILSQDPDMTQQQGSEMIENCRRTALAMFPGKELAFDLIYKPRLERVLRERFRTP
jgi:hypothetical protein